MPRARPRLLVVNQYYARGVEATGQLLAALCEALADEYEVTVVTGRATPAPGAAGPAGRVRVVRVGATAFSRARLAGRLANYGTYSALAVPAALAQARPDVVLAMTDPPWAGALAAAVARARGAPLVVVAQDVFPDVAVRLGRLRSPPAAAALGRLVRAGLLRADRVVAVGETMRARLEAKGVPAGRLRMIPNWVDTASLRPHQGPNRWAAAHGLEKRFVVMHAGNVGHAQDLDTLVRAAALLRDVERLAVVVVGGGARREELARLAAREGAAAVRFLPYQPREALPQVLSAGSLHVVGLARGLAGYVVPSRLLGVLAAGRPVVVAAEEESEVARAVRAARCGVVVPPGEPEALAAVLRDACEGRLPLEELGAAGRRWVEAERDVSSAVAAYRALLREVRAG